MKIIKEENVSHETLKNIFYVKKHVHVKHCID